MQGSSSSHGLTQALHGTTSSSKIQGASLGDETSPGPQLRQQQAWLCYYPHSWGPASLCEEPPPQADLEFLPASPGQPGLLDQ